MCCNIKWRWWMASPAGSLSLTFSSSLPFNGIDCSAHTCWHCARGENARDICLPAMRPLNINWHPVKVIIKPLHTAITFLLLTLHTASVYDQAEFYPQAIFSFLIISIILTKLSKNEACLNILWSHFILLSVFVVTQTNTKLFICAIRLLVNMLVNSGRASWKLCQLLININTSCACRAGLVLVCWRCQLNVYIEAVNQR